MATRASIPFDYHSHHHRCGHAQGEMADYIESALAQGMIAFGISDHGPAYWLPGDHDQPKTQMAKSEVGNYVTEAQALQQRYRDRIAMQVGIEADYIEGHEEELSAILDAHPFDYVLGSVHYAFGRNIFAPGRWEFDVVTVYKEYYRLVARAAASGLFDIMSHLTAVEAYAPTPPDTLAERWYTPVADAIANAGVIVEINTSGYRKMPPGPGKSGDEPFPDRRMLRLLIERGVPLTYGSDCHQPAEVGFGADRVRALLIELGVDITSVQPIRTKRRMTAESSGEILAFRTGK